MKLREESINEICATIHLKVLNGLVHSFPAPAEKKSHPLLWKGVKFGPF
jgi:hypothetical protein